MQQDLEKGYCNLLRWNSIGKTRWNYTWNYNAPDFLSTRTCTELRDPYMAQHFGTTRKLHRNCEIGLKKLKNPTEAAPQFTSWFLFWKMKKMPQRQTQLDSNRTLFWRMISGIANWCYIIWFLSRSPCTWFDLHSRQQDGKSLARELQNHNHVDIYTYIPLCKYVCIFSPASKPKQVPCFLTLSHGLNKQWTIG